MNTQETMNKSNEKETLRIDVLALLKQILLEWKLIIKVTFLGGIIGLIISYSVPKLYTVDVKLAPESSSTGGAISGMASLLGFGNMNVSSDADALGVSLYPDIVSSTPFLLDLFEVQVSTKKNEKMCLSSYLESQKSPWWKIVLTIPGKTIQFVKALFLHNDKKGIDVKKNDLFLTNEQILKIKSLRSSIICFVNKKTGITSLSITFQDPVVAAMAAERVLQNLQQYMTSYRTNKMQKNCDYLEQLFEERQKDYYGAQEKYARYVDMNQNIVRKEATTERERLQNEMNLSFQVYTQVATQLQVAKAKLQEAKPFFTVLEPPIVPSYPSNMGKMTIVLLSMFLALVISATWVLLGRESYYFLKRNLFCVFLNKNK